MSDTLKHECGVAAIRLLKPLSYFAAKYGTPFWAYDKLKMLMAKQVHRGQDGAGIGCVKLGVPLGDPYIFRARCATKDPLTNVFANLEIKINRKQLAEDADLFKRSFDFGGEVLVGHLRSGTNGQFDEGSCHPFLRRTNWPTRTLMVLGNFSMTNTQELNKRMIERGQHPVYSTDTQTVLEEIGYQLDEAHTSIYRRLRDQDVHGSETLKIISDEIDMFGIMNKSAEAWDGGYVILGAVGNGDFFCVRDPNGIRPCHYLVTDEFVAIASERVPLMTVFEVENDQVCELPPANMISIDYQGGIKVAEFTQPLTPAACSFEKIYSSRGNDPIVYQARKALGAALTPAIIKSIEGHFDKSVITFIPNTSETAYYGMIEGLREHRRRRICDRLIKALQDGTMTEDLIVDAVEKRWPRSEKIAHKDIKMRTFITKEEDRASLVDWVYDLTYGEVGEDEVLVAIDDSIVRGTTLRQSILRILGRTSARKIVIAATAPQIRYPDFYGIDMSCFGRLVAFQAAISLLRKRSLNKVIKDTYLACIEEQKKPLGERRNCAKAIYESLPVEDITQEITRLVTPEKFGPQVEVVFQTIEDLHASIEGGCGDWYFSGDYPTPGGYASVNEAYIRWYMEEDGYNLPL